MKRLFLFGIFHILASYKLVFTNGQLEQDTYLSPSGLVFLKEDNVIITGDSWTIVILINATQHLNNAIILQDNLIKLEKEMKETGLNYDEELSRLKSIVDNLLAVNRGFTDMLGKDRLKRELFQWIDFINPLFGKDNTEEIERLTEKVEKLQDRVTIQETFKEYQMSITKIFNNQVEQNAIKLEELTVLLKHEINKFKEFKLNLDRNNDVQALKVRVEIYSNLSLYFRLLESFALHSLILSSRLQSGLEMAAEGKLSFSLITAKELQSVLIKISSNLPFGLKLIAGLSIDDMYKHRQVSGLVAGVQNDLILLTIKLPLLSQERGFDLYSVYSLPVKDNTAGVLTRTECDKDSYLIASYDRQYYGIMDYKDVQQCRSNSPKICPGTITLFSKNVSSCLSSVFFKQQPSIQSYCKNNLLVKDHKPIWILDKKNSGWIYSIASPIKVTLHCGKKVLENIELVGTNILANVNHCTILGQDFKLLRTREGRSYFNGSTIAGEPIATIINPDLIEKLGDTEALEQAVEDLRKQGHLKEGIAHSEEVSMNLLLSRLEEGSSTGSYSSHINPGTLRTIVLPSFVALIISLAASYLVLFYDKNHVSQMRTPLNRVQQSDLALEEGQDQALKDQ